MPRFERTFKLWDYYITRSQLLMRSHKTVAHPTNIDIIFGDVEYVELPTNLRGLAIVAPQPAEVWRAEQVMNGPVPGERIFVIETKGRRYMVVASVMTISENELMLHESSLHKL